MKEKARQQAEEEQRASEEAVKAAAKLTVKRKGISDFVKKHFTNKRQPMPVNNKLYQNLSRIPKPPEAMEPVIYDSENIHLKQRKNRDKFCTSTDNASKTIAYEVKGVSQQAKE
ncbi:MAG: hypothetical protein V2I33_19355 [Kangiellaceae bacterium]|jgi:hypothetical protein|nr:hypothetical protein [Kangiellaceae bacterium]